MNWAGIGVGFGLSLVMGLLLLLITRRRGNLSPLFVFRSYVFAGFFFLVGLYMVGVGAGIAPSPVALRKMWDDYAIGRSAKPDKEHRQAAKEMTDEVAGQIAAELKSDDKQQLAISLADLNKFPPQDVSEAVRAEVETGLIPLLDHGEVEVQKGAATALATWGSVQCVPHLIEATDEKHDIAVRRAALGSLGDLKDPRAVEPLGKLVTSAVGGAAREALKKIGPPAEPLALTYLQNEDWHWQKIGCELLVEVGTAASLPQLEELEKADNRWIRGDVAAALKAIREREPAAPDATESETDPKATQ